MQSLEIRAILIALAAIVVLAVRVALIGYPILILIALIATFVVFVLMILVSVDDIEGLVKRAAASLGRREQPGR